MGMILRLLLLGIGISALLHASADAAWASLGERGGSVSDDRRALSAEGRGTETRTKYTVRHIGTASFSVREYVSRSNIVFGVAWNGRINPDLGPLLGSYHEEYQKALKQAPRQPGRRSLRVMTRNIIVERWGHMRNLQGRAFVPALLPEGVTPDEIR